MNIYFFRENKLDSLSVVECINKPKKSFFQLAQALITDETVIFKGLMIDAIQTTAGSAPSNYLD